MSQNAKKVRSKRADLLEVANMANIIKEGKPIYLLMLLIC